MVPPEEMQITGTLDLYWDEHTHRSPQFIEQVEETIVDFLETVGVDPRNKVRMITKQMCRRWKEKLIASGIRPLTIQRKYGILNHWLKWCWRQEFIESVPSDGLQLPARTVSDSRRRRTSFTPDEIRAILNDPHLREKQAGPRPIDKEYFWCVMLLAYTGARAGEIVHLRRASVKQEEGIWFLELEVDKELGVRLKNRYSIRRVPIHSAVLKLGFLDFVSAGTSQFLFPNTLEKHQPAASVSSKFKNERDFREPSGKADRSKTLHSLRHLMAVNLAKAKVDPSVRHALLGHAQGSSVEDRIYLEGLKFELHELVSWPEDRRVRSTTTA
jgi:integrase